MRESNSDSGDRRTHGLWLVGVLLVALLVRLAAAWWWEARTDGKFGFADSESYWALAEAIARGQDYQFGTPDARVFRTPGYPLLLAGLFLLAGDEPSVFAARIVGALLGTIGVGGIYWLAVRLFDRRTALVAALVGAIYPGLVAESVFVLSEAALCPLLIAQLCAHVAVWQAEQPGRKIALSVLAGCLAGAATLVRPSWLLFTPFLVALLTLVYPPRRMHLFHGMVSLLALAVVMSPWWIRNGRITGRFVPTTLQVGASLYDGLGPQATGASDMSFLPRFEDEQRESGATDDEFEYRLDRRLRKAALSSAAEDPLRVIRLAGVKFYRMWNVWPNEPRFSHWPLRLIVLASYAPVMLLAMIGVWKYSRRGWPYVLCWLPAAYFTALHLVFVSSIRYRHPAMLGLIVLAAAAGVEFFQRWKRSP